MEPRNHRPFHGANDGLLLGVNAPGIQEGIENQNRAPLEMLRIPIAVFRMHARCRGFGAKLDQQDSRSRGYTRVVCRSGNRHLHFDGTLRET